MCISSLVNKSFIIHCTYVDVRRYVNGLFSGLVILV